MCSLAKFCSPAGLPHFFLVCRERGQMEERGHGGEHYCRFPEPSTDLHRYVLLHTLRDWSSLKRL